MWHFTWKVWCLSPEGHIKFGCFICATLSFPFLDVLNLGGCNIGSEEVLGVATFTLCVGTKGSICKSIFNGLAGVFLCMVYLAKSDSVSLLALTQSSRSLMLPCLTEVGDSCLLIGIWKAVMVVLVLAHEVVVPGNAPPIVTFIFEVASMLVVLDMHGVDVVFKSLHPDALPTAVLAGFLLFEVMPVLIVPGIHGADVVLLSSHSSLGKSDALPTATLAGFSLLVHGDGRALSKSWFLSVSSFNTLGLSL